MLLPAAPDGNSPQKLSTKHKPAEPSGPLYLPLNLEYPGLRKVHQNPPVYICENFLTDEEWKHSSRLQGRSCSAPRRTQLRCILVHSANTYRGFTRLVDIMSCLALKKSLSPERMPLQVARPLKPYEPYLPPCEENASVSNPAPENPATDQQTLWAHGAASSCTIHGQPALR